MKRIAFGIFALTIACSAQTPQTPAPDYSAFTRSYTLPYTHPVDFSSLEGLLHVNASINGGPVSSFDVDTGSIGIVVAADDVPDIDPHGRPDHILYSSSGVEEDGVRTMATVRFPDAIGDDGKPHPVEVRVEVLAVTKTICHDMGPNSGHCHPNDHPHTHMMGIGFGRGADPVAVPYNAFLSLSEMLAGTMRAGYIIQPDGIHLGLTAKNAGSGFVFQKLQPRPGIPAGGPRDWLTAPGGFSVNGARTSNATVLMDTGLTNMMIAAPGQQPGEVPDGTPMTIYLPGGLTYSFKVADAGSMTPRRVTWVEPKHGAYINTGLHALAQTDYLYDADGGYLGLRPRK